MSVAQPASKELARHRLACGARPIRGIRVSTCAIVGMHRSGTSLVARGVNLLGFSLGDPDDLIAAGPDNPRGFWESRAVVSFHDSLLLALGGSWDAPPTLVDGWETAPNIPDRDRLDGLVTEVFGPAPRMAWKDPRGSLLLPYWGERIDHTLVVIRNPVEVRASLARRSDMDARWADYLWLRYTASAVAEARNRVVVPYEAVLQSPGHWFERLGESLGVVDIAGRIDAFLDHADPGERHERAASEPSASPDDLTTELYAALLAGPTEDVLEVCGRIARGRWDDADDPRIRTLQTVHDELQRVRVAVAPMVPLRTRWRELTTEVAQRDTKLEDLNRRVAELREEVARTLESRDAERRRGTELEVRSQQARAALERQRLRTDNVELQLREARTLITDLERRLEGVQRDLHETAALRRDLSRQLRRTEEQLRSLRNRRGVRAALKLASIMKPVIRRSSGTGPAGAPPPEDTTVAVPERESKAPGDRRLAVTPLTFDPTTTPFTEPVTLVIPVHDSPDEVRRCLDAVVRNTTSPARLIVVDDASRLDETKELLAAYERLPSVTVLRNDENLGFTRSVNRGLESCDTDVVILNSDTEVPPRWLQGLRVSAYSADDIGSATAVSNDAGAFSVPVIGERNEVPGFLGVDAAGRAIARHALWALPESPTGNGFCLYVRRAMLDEVGLLDGDAFPVGYGEENDLCMRAGRAGWRHVVADSVFVRHAKGSSFGSRREQLIADGRKIIDERYPEYTERVRAFVSSDAMSNVRDAARAALWDRSSITTPSGGPRVLYVLHEGRGGTPATSLDLGVELADRYDSMLLTSDTRTLRLSRITTSGVELVEEHSLERPIEFADHHRVDVRALLADILVRHAIELVHVRHVVKNTLDVFDVARDLDIPYVVSFHDFYLSCPTVHLLDDEDRFCGGLCTPGDGNCRIPMGWIAETAPHLKHSGVHEWRDLVRPCLQNAAALVTTSETARDVYLRSYPSLDPSRFHVIEHGRDLEREPIGWLPPEPDEAIRILVPGNLDVHKGSDLLRRMLDADADKRIEVHQLGELDDDSELLGVAHGPYERHQFVDRVEEIQPHLIGIFATWAETYNHTLSEAWMTGVPVVATDIGALGERIRAHGGGFLVPHDDPDEALRRILELTDDPAALAAACALADGAVRTVAAMADDYDLLYRTVLATRRTLDPVRPLRVALMALGRRSEAPGSVQVRSLRPLSHPALFGDVAASLTTAEDFIAQTPSVDVAMVQRTAVPPEQIAGLLACVRDRSLPLVVDVDDLLFDPHVLPDSSDQDWERHVDAMRTLIQAADLVTVSTPIIAEAASTLNPDVALVANHLDERLWFVDHEPAEIPDDPHAPLRLFYMGSKTHHADLELLRPVLDGLRQRLDRPVELDVVGGTNARVSWFHRIRVPRNTANYPAFARWLATVAPGHVVALAPLLDTPFTKAKSDLKWLEYSALGLPGVYSDVPAYGSVTHGVTGLVVDNDPARWIDATARLVEDRAFAAEIVHSARQEILANRILDRQVRQRIGLYRVQPR